MIKKRNVISQLPKKETRLKITASLLNSWQRIFDTKDDVFENENDDISLEDKIVLEMEKRKLEFINVLKRVKTPPTEHMLKGIEFENRVVQGLEPVFSPIVAGAAYQVTLTRDAIVDNIPIRVVGVIDFLKAGIIIDTKRVIRYKYPKYKTSHQHPAYFFLLPQCRIFDYLICDDNVESKDEAKRLKAYHKERYERENCEDILKVISQFFSWLKANDLFDLYIQNWAIIV